MQSPDLSFEFDKPSCDPGALKLEDHCPKGWHPFLDVNIVQDVGCNFSCADFFFSFFPPFFWVLEIQSRGGLSLSYTPNTFFIFS